MPLLLLVLLLTSYCAAFHLSVGCYAISDVSYAANFSSGITCVVDCSQACDGYFYFGITAGSICLCLRPEPFFIGSATPSYDSIAYCSDDSCTNDRNLCGSANYVSVFRMAGVTSTDYSLMDCYQDIPVLLSDDKGESNSTDDCASLCPYPNYKYFALGRGGWPNTFPPIVYPNTHCYCGGRLLTTAIYSTECIESCNGNPAENCGGVHALRTYKWDLTDNYGYVGCYAYQNYTGSGSPKRPLLFQNEPKSYQDGLFMSTDRCSSICADYPFFAVSGGDTCYCGDQFPSAPVQNSFCSTPCVGDINQTCGGTGYLSVFQSTQVFCGDGIVSGIEECDLAEMTQSTACTGCRILARGWSCTNVDPTVASPIDFDSPYYSPGNFIYLAREHQTLNNIAEDVGNAPYVLWFGELINFAGCGCQQYLTWILFPQPDGTFFIRNIARNGWIAATNFTDYDGVAEYYADNVTEAALNPCGRFVVERSKDGYGFLLHPACALHLNVGVGFNGPSGWQAQHITLAPERQVQRYIFITFGPTAFKPQQTTICTPVCGDGIPIAPEVCDDGNLNNGDGCNSQCQVEPLHECVAQYKLPFDQSLTPQAITANPNLYDFISVATASGYFLALPSSNDTDFLVSPWTSVFLKSSIDGATVTKFGIHPALNASNGLVYLGVKAPLPSNIEGNVAYFVEYRNATSTLPLNCYYKQEWSDYRPAGCVNCGSPTAVNTCGAPIPEMLRWELVFNSATQSWNFFSGVTRTRLVIVYPSYSSYPVQEPQSTNPYVALTNDSFYNADFDIYNFSTSPAVKLLPIISSLCRPICGDGIVIPPETCDDRKTNPGACHNVTCTVLPGWICPYNNSLLRSDCRAKCGDGRTVGAEECDDGFGNDGPAVHPIGNFGCTDQCTNKTGWTCYNDYVGFSGSNCSTNCGDGVLLAPEVCDDNNTVNDGSDGCTNCQVTLGWYCDTGSPSTCKTVCGDGHTLVGSNETCDDGFGTGSSLHPSPSTIFGCSDVCKVIPGWNCINDVTGFNKSNCTPVCGDGIVVGGETCDDFNTFLLACLNCQVQTGWECPHNGTQSVCNSICGDGILPLGSMETCDDGVIPPLNGDGCNDQCRIEMGWSCVDPDNITTFKSICDTICFNSILTYPETCEVSPGNNGSQGCLNCRTMQGWACVFDALSNNESDCKAVCGDGYVVVGVEDCDDHVIPSVDGDGCSASCTVEIGWNCTSYDSILNKSICLPVCGDGYVTGSEGCDDGSALNGVGGCNLTCQIVDGWACTFTTIDLGQGRLVLTSSCPSPICGDGKVIAPETCDDGLTPALDGDGCSATCHIEPHYACPYTGTKSNCTPVCGDYFVVSPEQCDSGPGPDSGCVSCVTQLGWSCPYNGSQSVCTPVCGDGLILGQEQCDDRVRPPAAGDGCSESCKIESGWNCTYISAANKSFCAPYCGDGIVIGNETCDDFVNTGNGCMACQTEDGWSCSYNGSQSVCSPVCGDGLVLGGEQCDDRVTPPSSGDGCSAVCTNETGWMCDYDSTAQKSKCYAICGDGLLHGNESCDDAGLSGGQGCFNCQVVDGWSCPYIVNASVCSVVCGDGHIVGAEECDDGVRPPVGGDGCSDTCQNETGWICSYDSAANKSVCAPVCGDGVVTPPETCDDFLNNGSGCVACRRQEGWNCPYVVNQSVCSSICGDGVIVGTEECDDHIQPPTNGDGCSASCKREFGWNCPYNLTANKSSCTPICGDGLIRGSEKCDDANGNTGNGCLACAIEGGWICPYIVNRSVCSPICGDGQVISPVEECDDGVTPPVSGDGCSSSCKNETGYICNYNSTLGKSVCSANCGDGKLYGTEKCDDFNSGYGCVNCQIATGFSCIYNGTQSICSPICGDGVIVGLEQCDDGVSPPVAGDGCSDTCQNETGFICIYDILAVKSVCAPFCGDGVVRGNESCDDFNTSANGCIGCQTQSGFTCPYNGSQSVCSPICGDGLLLPSEACDKIVQLRGCDSLCHVIQGYKCVAYNLTSGDCSAVCGDGILVGAEECDDGNLVSGDGCTSNCTLEPSFVCNFPNSSCELCYGPWVDVIFNQSLVIWSQELLALGLPMSFIQSLSYTRCSYCALGTALSTRQVDTKPYCTNTTTTVLPCNYPCRDLSSYSFARESVNALKLEFDKGLLQEILRYFGLSVTYSVFTPSKKRDELQTSLDASGLAFSFSPCNSSNISQAVTIVNTLSGLIVPNAPHVSGSLNGCNYSYVANDNSTAQSLVGVYAGAGAGAAVLLILLLIAAIVGLYIYKHMDKSDLHLLPKEIRWSYEEWFDEKKHWDFQGGFVDGKKQGYYYKLLRKLKEGEDEDDLSKANWKYEGYNKVMDLFEFYCCNKDADGNVYNPFIIKQITQIYNRDLVTSFITNWRTQNSRVTTADHLFASEGWRPKSESLDLADTLERAVLTGEERRRQAVLDFYRARVASCPWNADYLDDEKKACAITLAVHGTDLPIARSIAQTGFANLSSLDAGFYGRGIYFSTFAQYVFMYIFQRANPCIILSWVACGHTYPVIERHDARMNSLLGLPIKAGYMSHYVQVNSCGLPQSSDNDVSYDEIVIPQESQIAPAFILHLERSNFREIAEDWDRICQNSLRLELAARAALRNDGSITDRNGNPILNPREIPLMPDASQHAALSPRAPVSARADLLVASDVSLAPSIATHVASSTGSSARGKPDGEQSPVAPSRVADPELDLKDKTVGVLTGQFVQTKSTHISLNPLLLHKSRVARDRGAAKRSDAWDYQRGAETKGEKLPKAYVRKETYKANQEAAQALRLELQQMKNTETFHSAELHWTLFTEFEEIQYFNYCRLKEEKADSVATPIIIGVSPDSLYLCDPVKGNTIKTIADHLISSVTYENDCSILIEFAYQHPPLHIQNESIEALACVLKKMFEIRVHDLLKVCMEKEKQFLDKGSCTVDERCQLLIGKHTSAVKFTFDTSFLSIVEKSSKLCRNYQWSEIAAIHMVLDMDGTLQVYMNDSASPSFILDHSNGATNIVLFHLFYRFHDTSKRLSDKSHTVVEI